METMKMAFLPVFWSLTWFKNQPGTIDVLCGAPIAFRPVVLGIDGPPRELERLLEVKP